MISARRITTTALLSSLIMAHSGTAAQLAEWAQQCRAAASYVGIPDYILWGVFGVETNFGRYIDTSSADAQGLMQFIPSTAREWNYPLTNYPNASQSQAQFTAAALKLRADYKRYGSWDGAIRIGYGGGYGLAQVTAKANSNPQPSGTPKVSTSGPAPYVNPLREAHVRGERVDQGVDYAGDGHLVAIAECEIVVYIPNGWRPYGNYLEYTITQKGSLNGVHIYYAEGITSTWHAGDRVSAGTEIATLIPGWQYGIECGFAAGDGQGHTWAHTFGGGYVEGYSTRAGIAYDELVRALGGVGGVQQARVMGSWPSFRLPTHDELRGTPSLPGAVAPQGANPKDIADAFRALNWAGGDINLWKYLKEGADGATVQARDYWHRLYPWKYLNPYKPKR